MKNINWTTLGVAIALVFGLFVALRAGMKPEQITALAGAAVMVAAQLSKLHGPPPAPSDEPPPPPIGPPMLLVLFLAFETGTETACTPNPGEQKAIDDTVNVEKTACRVVKAFADDGTPKTVCAVADELANMASLITAKRAAAGPSFGRRSSCEALPGSALCATNAERLEAIEATLRRRGGS